jgi:hypothetical protein
MPGAIAAAAAIPKPIPLINPGVVQEAASIARPVLAPTPYASPANIIKLIPDVLSKLQSVAKAAPGVIEQLGQGAASISEAAIATTTEAAIATAEAAIGTGEAAMAAVSVGGGAAIAGLLAAAEAGVVAAIASIIVLATTEGVASDDAQTAALIAEKERLARELAKIQAQKAYFPDTQAINPVTTQVDPVSSAVSSSAGATASIAAIAAAAAGGADISKIRIPAITSSSTSTTFTAPNGGVFTVSYRFTGGENVEQSTPFHINRTTEITSNNYLTNNATYTVGELYTFTSPTITIWSVVDFEIIDEPLVQSFLELRYEAYVLLVLDNDARLLISHEVAVVDIPYVGSTYQYSTFGSDGGVYTASPPIVAPQIQAPPQTYSYAPPVAAEDEGYWVFPLDWWVNQEAALKIRMDALLIQNQLIIGRFYLLNSSVDAIGTAISAIATSVTTGFADAEAFYGWYQQDYGISLMTLMLNGVGINLLTSDTSLVVGGFQTFIESLALVDMNGNALTNALFADLQAILNALGTTEQTAANNINIANANLYNAIQQIGNSVKNAVNVIGSNIAQWGNALKIYGAVGRIGSYLWQNYTPDFFKGNPNIEDK